jgi:hypothetical protein
MYLAAAGARESYFEYCSSYSSRLPALDGACRKSAYVSIRQHTSADMYRAAAAALDGA